MCLDEPIETLRYNIIFEKCIKHQSSVFKFYHQLYHEFKRSVILEQLLLYTVISSTHTVFFSLLHLVQPFRLVERRETPFWFNFKTSGGLDLRPMIPRGSGGRALNCCGFKIPLFFYVSILSLFLRFFSSRSRPRGFIVLNGWAEPPTALFELDWLITL